MALDVMSMIARLGIDKSDYEKGMKEAEGGFKNFGSNLKKGVANVAKIAAGAAAAGATALAGITVALTKSAVSAYGEYEQLVGGVDTLFKGSSKRVQEYAANAYKTAGMSANQYMETVTGFSAALIQSMGGDTKAAADLADQAIRDMSDNANKMGSDISSIQNAYQGFAKGNYTMLDNLKLGYGGTKEEMDRLITDAMKLDKSFQANTKTVIKNKKQVKELDYNYADVVRAINIVQTNMGITGATAAEAADTIQGSIAATKAAWENVLTSIGTGKGMKDATKNLVASAGNVIKNIKPVIQRALSGIGDLIVNLAPQVVRAIPQLVSGIVPGIMSTAGRLASAITRALPKIWTGVKNYVSQRLFPAVSKLIASALGRGNTSMMGERLSRTFGAIFDRVVSVVEGIGAKVSEFWSKVLQPILGDIVEFVLFYVLPSVSGVMDRLAPVLSWIGGAVSQLFDRIAGWWSSYMVPIFVFLGERMDAILPMVGAVVAGIAAFAIAKKISNIVGVIKGLFAVVKAHPFAAVISVLAAVVGWVIHLYQTNEEARDKIDAAFTAIKGFWTDTLKPAFEEIYTYVVETLIPTLIEWWDTKLKPTIETVFTAIKTFWEETLKPAFEDIYTYVVETLIPTLIEWWDTKLKPTIETVFNAIKTFWEETLKPAFEDIYDYVIRDLIPTLIVWWEYHLKPTIETVFTAIKTFWEETLKPAFEDIYKYVVETLIPTLQEKWEAVQPVLQTVFEAISGFVGDLGDKFKTVWDTYLRPVAAWVTKTFVTAWDTLKTQLQNLIDFVSGVFSGDWGKAWDALVNMVKTPFDTLGEILKTPINAVIGLLNKMLYKVGSAINKMINGINNKLHLHFEGVEIGWPINKTVAAFDWSPNLKQVSWGFIPMLAKGGIVSNGGEAIVGEYRPEHLRVVNGKAVVTPLNTGRFPGGGEEIVTPRTQAPRMLNVTLKIRDSEIAHVLLPLLEAEEQRVGVRLATGGV